MVAQATVLSRAVDERVERIDLRGEFDLVGADRLRHALQAAADRGALVVRVDASAVGLMDSTTLGVLLFFGRHFADHGGGMELTYPAVLAPQIGMSGLDRLVEARSA
jgi:anti-anti-sigma factor